MAGRGQLIDYLQQNILLVASLTAVPQVREAARRLGVAPARTAVVEDAVAGVEAGRRGGFALVVGVDRHGQADTLKKHGADVVVEDLGELLPGGVP